MRAPLLALFALLLRAPTASADDIPRPEHPNPQFQRDEWQNLNGSWDFWEGDAADEKAMAARSDFPDRIVVPFCRESKLSGLGRTGFVKNVLYRRRFDVPKEWGIGEAGAAGGDASKAGARLMIHVGACDWRTTVWVDGVRVGFHEGGSTPIDCDATDALASGSKDGSHELRVWAFDDTASGVQQTGKQSKEEKSHGCVYTRTTGIWQTVWMERVGATFFESCSTESDFGAWGQFIWDVSSGSPGAYFAKERAVTVRVRPRLHGDCENLFVVADVRRNDNPVLTVWRPASGRGEFLELWIRDPRLWSQQDPQLYDLTLTLRRADRSGKGWQRSSTGDVVVDKDWPVVVDQVHTHFGLRQVERDGLRVLINHEPVFQRLILDQGFYPDGIWTAPSDAALKHDIEMSMAAGFNGARLHQKVFEPRFLYWADKLGYLVWGEAPSWGANYANPAVDRVVLDEWRAEVERDRNHPSIVGWCPFNETDATPAKLQNAATALTRALDPTRPVLDTSGYVHSDPRRDVDDAHDYDQDPASFRARWWPRGEGLSLPARYHIPVRDRPFFVSEFGGIGWLKPGDPGWSYGDAPKSEAEWFKRFEGLCDAQLENPSLFGFCYTQLTDVEQERNGLYYYDRTPKFDVARLHAIVAKPAAIESEKAIAKSPASAASSWRVVIPARVDEPGRNWSYVALDKPIADDVWQHWKLDGNGALAGSTVLAGRPAFGTKGGFEALIGTPWKSDELYLMRNFVFDGAPFESAQLVMHYDNAVQILVNGELLFDKGGWNDGYEPFDVTERARALLKKGPNVITVHVHQDTGGQFFDAALLVAPASTPGIPPVER
jgi:glycosyl hydrolase family 2